MGKSMNFIIRPVLSQLLKLIDKQKLRFKSKNGLFQKQEQPISLFITDKSYFSKVSGSR